MEIRFVPKAIIASSTGRTAILKTRNRKDYKMGL